MSEHNINQMNTRRIAKAPMIIAAGCCLILAAAALGQSGMTPNPDVNNPTTLTPQQRAEADQRLQTDKAAIAALNAGRYDEAVADAQNVLSLNADDLLAPKILAQSLEAQGKMPEALAAYQVLADRGSSHPEDLMPYALLLLHEGQWERALAAYEKALPFVGEGKLLRADDGFSFDTPNQTALEAAIHMARGLTDSIGNIVMPYPDNVKALTEFQKALALTPNSALANYHYGWGLQRLGRRAEAKAAFQKAAALDGGDIKRAAEEALKRG